MPSDQEGMAINHLFWDERVETHFNAPLYRPHLEKLRSGGDCLFPEVVEGVGDVSGKSLVHLQCHFGLETISWARRGAIATGLDYSQPAIDLATDLAGEFQTPARFVCANVYDAVDALGDTYDIVYTSIGVLCWLPDLDRWAHVIADLLEPGGLFYIFEGHPFINIFERTDAKPGIKIEYEYFRRKPLVLEADGTYADPDATFDADQTVEWLHTMSDIVNALIGAGLRIESMREFPHDVWHRFDVMERKGDDRYRMPEPMAEALPFNFELRAVKPGP